MSSIGFFSAAFSALMLVAAIRARAGGDPVSLRVLIIVAAVGIALISFAGSLVSSAVAIALAYVAVCTVTDLSSGLVYDAVTYPAAVAIGFCVVAGGSVASAIEGSGTALLIAAALHVLSGRRGLGMGDVKLFGVIGGALSAVPAMFLIGASFVCGGLFVACGLLLGRMRLGQRVPFVPYVAFATGCLVLAGGRF